jgi:hypothetical protein
MAQQSARRGWDNQGFTQCFEHAAGDLDPARELPYRPAAVFCRFKGRTDDSIRPRATMIPKFSLAWEGGVHRWNPESRQTVFQQAGAKPSISERPAPMDMAPPNAWPAKSRSEPLRSLL